MAKTARSKSARRSKSPPRRPRDSVVSGPNPEKLALTARRHPLVAQVQRQLDRCGVPGGSAAPLETPVVIGVSGGADSVALLLSILAISGRRRGAGARGGRMVPIAVHVHHHLRPSAKGDAAWVARLCVRFGIECRVEHVHPSKLNGNISANARRLRYAALLRIAHEIGAGAVAVAHHGEDQLETILIALCRGAGLDGLAGMAWSRPLDDRVMLVRPLLGVRKSDCQSFCEAAGVKWREDPTNSDASKARSRLRRDVLPVLEELWPDAARRVMATADLLEAARAALQRQVEESFGPPAQRQWPRALLKPLPGPIIAAGLRRAALHAAPSIADDLSQRLLLPVAAAIRSDDRTPHRFDWPGGLGVRVNSRQVALGVK